jgi:hypothetical protein
LGFERFNYLQRLIKMVFEFSSFHWMLCCKKLNLLIGFWFLIFGAICKSIDNFFKSRVFCVGDFAKLFSKFGFSFIIIAICCSFFSFDINIACRNVKFTFNADLKSLNNFKSIWNDSVVDIRGWLL